MSSMTAATRPRRLDDKTAVIVGARGEVGSAVAKELAAQGARLFLSGQEGAGEQVQQVQQDGIECGQRRQQASMMSGTPATPASVGGGSCGGRRRNARF